MSLWLFLISNLIEEQLETYLHDTISWKLVGNSLVAYHGDYFGKYSGVLAKIYVLFSCRGQYAVHDQ